VVQQLPQLNLPYGLVMRIGLPEILAVLPPTPVARPVSLIVNYPGKYPVTQVPQTLMSILEPFEYVPVCARVNGWVEPTTNILGEAGVTA